MKQKTDFQTFISYFKPHRRLFFLDLACALMISLIDLAFPFVLIGLFSSFILYLYNLLLWAYVWYSCRSRYA